MSTDRPTLAAGVALGDGLLTALVLDDWASVDDLLVGAGLGPFGSDVVGFALVSLAAKYKCRIEESAAQAGVDPIHVLRAELVALQGQDDE